MNRNYLEDRFNELVGINNKVFKGDYSVKKEIKDDDTAKGLCNMALKARGRYVLAMKMNKEKRVNIMEEIVKQDSWMEDQEINKRYEQSVEFTLLDKNPDDYIKNDTFSENDMYSLISIITNKNRLTTQEEINQSIDRTNKLEKLVERLGPYVGTHILIERLVENIRKSQLHMNVKNYVASGLSKLTP